MKTGSASARTVLIVDDSATVREAVRWALDDATDFVVVGEAGDANEALQRASMLEPDIVLLDIEMPDSDGYLVCRTLKSRSRAPIVIFLTVHGDAASQLKAQESGGDGFVSKGAGWYVLLAAIRDAMRQAAGHPLPNSC